MRWIVVYCFAPFLAPVREMFLPTVEITASALKLDWHREELRRARTILIEMGLIRPRADGRYVLGSLGPFAKIDELIRDQYLDLKLLEDVVLATGAIMAKSKTQERSSSSSASQMSGRKKSPFVRARESGTSMLDYE